MSLPLELLSENFVRTRNITSDTFYEIFEIEASELLCPERIDLAAKIAYIEAYESKSDMEFAKDLYTKHIEAFSEGYFTEPGDNEKTSIEKYLSVFNELIEDFKENGFSNKKSLIPVGENNIILDGSHRTACAVYFKQKVTVIKFENFSVNFNYDYFRNRHLSEEMLEYMSVTYGKWSGKNLYFACFWPISDIKKRSEALDIIKEKYKIILETDVDLNKNGLRNLMMQIYQNQDWIGNAGNHFAGAMGKVNSCFLPFSSIKAVFFEGEDLESIVEMKDRIRKFFNIGKHAVHISDSNEEARSMSSLLFQKSTVHALNYGCADEFPAYFERIQAYKGKNVFLNENATLSYYGIEESIKIISEKSVIDMHNPRTFFVFDGMMLPSLEFLKSEKSRTISADSYKKVVKLINETIGNISFKRKMQDLKTNLSWKRQMTVLRLKQFLAKIAQKIGVYEVAHRFLHRGD